MTWLKKNLFLVVGALVALGLLGFAGYFLYNKIELESGTTAKLDEQTAELDRLYKLEPNPGNEKVNNIEAARKQEQELTQFGVAARRSFEPMDYPKSLDPGQLKLLLDNTINDLQRSAERANVKLPSPYYFSFAAQKSQMFFEPQQVAPLAMAVVDVRTICQILFQSKVLTLDNIRRVPLAAQDTPGPTADFWTKKPVTNDFAIIVPYEITVHGFTAELGAVVEGHYSNPHGLTIKNVVVDPTPSPLLAAKDAADATPTYPQYPMGMSQGQLMMMMRYGMGRRYMQPTPEPQAAPTPAPGARGGLTPMLDEKPFRAVLWVDVVRLREPGQEATKPGRPARAPRVAADSPSP